MELTKLLTPNSLPLTAFIGGHSEEVPPVLIPNTEVKLFCANGTAWATMWESRSPPITCKQKPRSDLFRSGFLSWSSVES